MWPSKSQEEELFLQTLTPCRQQGICLMFYHIKTH